MLEFTIPLIPRTKKNSMVRTKHGMIQSAAYRAYEKDCLKIIPPKYRIHIDRPCIVTTVFFMPDRRRVDVSNLISACHDVLVKAGVLTDDDYTHIPKIIAWHEVDRKNPRTEVTIEEVIE